MSCFLVSSLRSFQQDRGPKDFLLCFSAKSFIVLHFILKFMIHFQLNSGLEDSDRGCFCVSLASLMEQGLWVGGLKSGFSLGWCNFLIWEMTFLCLLESGIQYQV